MSRKEHLTIEGLHKIVAIKASLNLGLSEELKVAFSNIIPMKRPLVIDQVIKNPHWVAGFTSGEGCFMIQILKSSTHNTRFQVQLVFSIVQHSRDIKLMKIFKSYFGCGNIVSRNNKNYIEFTVRGFGSVSEKIIPFFDKYTIIGIKALDFSDFCKVAELIKNKAHLTEKGIE